MSEEYLLPCGIANEVRVEVEVGGDGNNEPFGEEADGVNFDSDVDLLMTVARLLQSGSWTGCSLEVRKNLGDMLVDLGKSLKGFENLYRCKDEKNRELMKQKRRWAMRCQVLEEKLEQGQGKQHVAMQRMREEHAEELARVRREFEMELEELRRAAQREPQRSVLEVEVEPRPNPIRVPNREKNLICSICTKAYSTSQGLARHLPIHRSDRPLKCPQCPQRFKVYDRLRKHLVTHSNRRPYQCHLCEKTFKRSDELGTHLLIHTGERPHSCQVCKKTFRQLPHLNYHLRTHRGDDGGRMHQQRHHKSGLTPAAVAGAGKPAGLNEMGQLKAEQTAEWISKQAAPAVVEVALQMDSEEPVATVEIKKEVPDASVPVLSSHGKLGTVSGEISNHNPDQLMVLQPEKPVKCPQCSQRFKCRSNLHSHLVVHSERKPFQCELCEKKFKRSSELLQHRRFHTGERPYSCKVCNMTFSYSGSLSNHMQTHQGEEGKVLECTICKQTFSRKSSLRKHQRRLHKFELASQ